jgi:hypothetical protein
MCSPSRKAAARPVSANVPVLSRTFSIVRVASVYIATGRHPRCAGIHAQVDETTPSPPTSWGTGRAAPAGGPRARRRRRDPVSARLRNSRFFTDRGRRRSGRAQRRADQDVGVLEDPALLEGVPRRLQVGSRHPEDVRAGPVEGGSVGIRPRRRQPHAPLAADRPRPHLGQPVGVGLRPGEQPAVGGEDGVARRAAELAVDDHRLTAAERQPPQRAGRIGPRQGGSATEEPPGDRASDR